MSATTPAFPTVEAVMFPDGTGEVRVNGVLRPLTATTTTATKAAILRVARETAMTVERPVRLATTGPEGDWPLIVHPDGLVEPDGPGTPAPLETPAGAASAPYEEPAEAPAGPSMAPAPAPTVSADAGATVSASVELPTGASPWIDPPQEEAPERGEQAGALAPAQDAGAGTRREARASFLTQAKTDEPAAQGWRGLLSRAGLRMSPSAHELAEREDVHAVSQHWPGPRTIAIVNGKGGAGKTPTTVLLATTFARHGGAGVLAWDNNQTRGTLGWRTEQGPHEATLLDLLPHTNRLLGTGAHAADLAHHQTRDRFDVLRSKPIALAAEQRLQPADVDAIRDVATKFYRLVIIDSGNDETDPMWLRMIDHTDQLVVATTTRDDHAEAGALLLEALTGRDQHSAQLARNAVVVINQSDPRASTSDLTRVSTGFAALAREALTIPHDPAMIDGVLRHASLRPATQRAWLAAAAAIARGL